VCPEAAAEGWQFKLRVLPLWSDGQQIGNGVDPQTAANGFGSAAKRPVLVTPGRSEVWMTAGHRDPASGGTTKIKSILSVCFRSRDSRSVRLSKRPAVQFRPVPGSHSGFPAARWLSIQPRLTTWL
jgi:hypothetical protein